jgi:hypothetical protein
MAGSVYLLNPLTFTQLMNNSQHLLRRELEPFLEMLEEKNKTLSKDIWQQMVNSTAERIANAPDQYLTGNLKPSPQLEQAIQQIFKERLN